MRVMIMRERNGLREITIVPGRGAHLPPVTVRGTDKAAVREEAAQVIRAVSEAEAAKLVREPRL